MSITFAECAGGAAFLGGRLGSCRVVELRCRRHLACVMQYIGRESVEGCRPQQTHGGAGTRGDARLVRTGHEGGVERSYRAVRIRFAWECGATPGLLAQTVRGRVIEAASRRPVPTALVFASWDNGDSIGSTDTAGAFSARTIRSGQIVLRIERLGYRPVVTAPISIGAIETASLEIEIPRRPDPAGSDCRGSGPAARDHGHNARRIPRAPVLAWRARHRRVRRPRSNRIAQRDATQ